ncbi:UDP-N-acetylmuramate dehydrogenase [Microtetraspora fusca]|uniref:UDP-N-acetylmuramate dehydrogenase n=1 Tax=Microtetraspora fusca TaxID=1997 RepID=UPI0008366323|nr:UDP-N-acetylmuramate dehydrogenase [Microtetraspora fusca]
MGEQLSQHTTLRLGGPAQELLTHTDPATWPDLAHAARRHPNPPCTLGGGSNILAADAGYPGLVIRMATTGISARAVGDGAVEVTVQAGEPLQHLVRYTVAEHLSGIEYLAGIPGSVGAAPVQNSGAYGQQIADTLTAVTAHDWRSGQIVHLPATSCGFGYRTSRFKTEPGRWTILAVTLRLTRSRHAAPVTYQHLADTLGVPLGTRPPLAEAVDGVLADRRSRGLLLPIDGPDARQVGSVFLNPPLTPNQAAMVGASGGPLNRHDSTDGRQIVRASAGWLLQQCGHHPGQRLAPGVYCSTRRTLTLVASDGATATAFATALRTLAGQVMRQTGIRLRPEPVMVGHHI